MLLTYRIDISDISIKIPDARNMKRKGCVNIKQGQLDQAIKQQQLSDRGRAFCIYFLRMHFKCLIHRST